MADSTAQSLQFALSATKWHICKIKGPKSGKIANTALGLHKIYCRDRKLATHCYTDGVVKFPSYFGKIKSETLKNPLHQQVSGL